MFTLIEHESDLKSFTHYVNLKDLVHDLGPSECNDFDI